MTFSSLTIPFDTISLAKRDRAYIQSNPSLLSMLPFDDSLDGLRKKINNRKLFPFFRKELVEAIQIQHASLPHAPKTKNNIQLLENNNTFTVTTAHQPSLFSGPLYFIYKAASCIHLANLLQQEFPEFSFIPLFVLGAEDHDFEEINHLHLYNKVIQWNRPATGPTGMMDTNGLLKLIDDVQQILPKTENAQQIIQLLKESFKPNQSYGQATLGFVHRLFSKYGLVTLQMTDPKLKRLAIPIFRKEILEQTSFPLINKAIAQLKEMGFRPQAKPRALNLFYMTKNMRKRIVKDGHSYRVVDTNIQWSQTEILALLERSPERFSPNVILRPIYQELILPNIAYIGGGGELAYWQERYTQFQAFEISYPVLIRRNSVLWISPYTQKQLNKLKLTPVDLFQDTTTLLMQLDHSSDLSVKKQLDHLTKIFDELSQKANDIDPALLPQILAEKKKQLKGINQIAAKFTKAYKQKNQIKIQKIDKLKAAIFPKGALQERHDNLLPIYADFGQVFIDYLVKHLNPLHKQFVIIQKKQH